MEIVCRAGIQVTGSGAREVHDDIIVEDNVMLFLNGKYLTTLVASPDRLGDLGAGFVICEGLADEVDSVEVSGMDIYVTAPVEKDVHLEMESSGGYRVLGEPKEVSSSITVTADDIRAVTAAIESDTWRRTGASTVLSSSAMENSSPGPATSAGTTRSIRSWDTRPSTGLTGQRAFSGVPAGSQPGWWRRRRTQGYLSSPHAPPRPTGVSSRQNRQGSP